MKPYTVPTSQQRNRRRTLKGIIVKASNKREAMRKAENVRSRELSVSKTHQSTAEELESSDINGADLATHLLDYRYAPEGRL